MVSIVKVDQIKSSDGTTEYLNAGNIKNATLDSSVTNNSGVSSGAISSNATFPTGHIIQVKSTTKTDTTSRANDNTSTDYADISGMSVSITQKSNRKVFVSAMISITGREVYIPPQQETGNILFFPAYLLHRVTQVTRGTRSVIVGWVHGNSFT